MLKIEEFDIKVAMKDEYLAGRLSLADYSKWLKSQNEEPKVIIPAKKSIIDPNLAFLKRKEKKISFRTYKDYGEELREAKKKIEEEKKMVIFPEGKYAWMDHAQEPDDDVPF